MEIFPVLILASRTALTSVAAALVGALWKAYKRPLVLGLAIIGFSGGGLAMIIVSHAVTGWNQIALLGFGTSLLIVGTVELGILGVLKKIIDPDRTGNLIGELSCRFAVLESQLGMPTLQPTEFVRPEEARAMSQHALPAHEVAAILRKLAGRLDDGITDAERD